MHNISKKIVKKLDNNTLYTGTFARSSIETSCVMDQLQNDSLAEQFKPNK
jgi:hypothetical protein